MPLPLIIGGLAVVLLGVVGVSVFSWRVYAAAGVGPARVEVGVGGPGATTPGTGGAWGAGGGGGGAGASWGLVAALGVGAIVLLKVL